jgi:hypothetical protein
MSFDEFVATDARNLDGALRVSSVFRQLLPKIEALYEKARGLLPREGPLHLSRSFVLCHKEMFCAAAAIGRGHPEDAAPLTRRAIEIATTTFAITYDEDNLKRWIAIEKRTARWDARDKGLRPSPFHPELKLPPNHKTLTKLRKWLGMLSDVAVHFTPEYLSGQTVTQHEDPADPAMVQLRLSFHEPDLGMVERVLALHVGVHLMILNLFDEALRGRLSSDGEWHALIAETGKLCRLVVEEPWKRSRSSNL